jgi:histidyl-tRNA synthetase
MDRSGQHRLAGPALARNEHRGRRGGDPLGDVEQGRAGVAALRKIVAGAGQAGVAPERLAIDPSIARGLDYYTGIVLESFLDELPALGSICSGGRYDNLAGLYTKQPLPGVGASLGIDRLLAGLEELGRVAVVETPAEVFLVHFDAAHLECAGCRRPLRRERRGPGR